MNYFELYPGDYLRDTTRLTLIEHGAYLRLLMAYYAEETPLPADYAELHVIVSAISTADKAAVKKVADRFFPVGDDGVRRNGRADEEIAKAQRRIAIARENGSKGGRKPNPPGNPTGNPSGNPVGSPKGTQRDTQRGTRSGEALHTPHASTSIPSSEARTQIPQGDGTDAGRACALLKEAGCARVNPAHPDLLAALAEGVSPEALVHTYRENPNASNPFAWAIATARGRHAKGARPVAAGPPRRDLSDQPSRTRTALENLQGRKSDGIPTAMAQGRGSRRLHQAGDAEP